MDGTGVGGQMAKQSFLRGTFILSAAALVTRFLGFINGVFQARILGTDGIGLMMMAYPLVPLIITLTELGLPVAISNLVAEAEAKRDAVRIKRILQVSLTLTVSLSVLLTAAAFTFAKVTAAVFLPDQRAYFAMLAILPIAPVIAVSAVLKGYFRGKQNMSPIALSEIVIHIVQIVSTLTLVRFLRSYGIQYAAAGATMSIVIGEAISLLYLFSVMRTVRRGRENTAGSELQISSIQSPPRSRKTLTDLLQIGLPTMGNGVIFSVYRAFQPMLITKTLAVAGIGAMLATKQYGMMTGYVFPLLFLPSFVTESVSTTLIPAISEARAERNEILIHRRMDQAMRVGLMIGAPSTIILSLWAVPLTTVIYHSPAAGHLLKIVAPVFFLYFFDAPLYAVLLGLGKANAVLINFVSATLLKVAGMILLGSKFGIVGIILGINFGICLQTLLNFFSVTREIGFYCEAIGYVKVLFCAALMGISGQLVFLTLQGEGLRLVWNLIISLMAAAVIYLLMLQLTNAYPKHNANRFMFIRKWFSFSK